MPKVSIVIPTYKRAAMLRDRALRSVREQTFTDWECVVVDDGSEDDTEAVVRVIAAEDPRVRYFKKPNGGQASARNFGVREARGEFIGFTDDDDEFLPQYLEVAMKTFASLPSEVSYLVCDAVNRDEFGGETYSRIEVQPFWGNAIGGGYIFKRRVFDDKKLFFDEDKDLVGFEDLDLHLQFEAAGEHGHVIHEPLRIYYVSVRSKKSGSWSTNYARQRRNFERFFEKNAATYEAQGSEALAWITLFGGFVYTRNGMATEARQWFVRSWRLRSTALTTIYITVSFFGNRAIFSFDQFKNRAMRWIRSRFINRVG